MSATIVLGDWDINPNVRNAYTSLVDMTSWFMFENFDWMRDHGWTVKYTCNGTTGPTNAADHTDRHTTKATFVTRGAASGNAQSFAVLTNAAGVDVLLTFQGASDDICRISYSPGGLYTPAGTTNQQPTATDEVVVMAATTVVNATTSADRVMSIWTNGEGWFFALFRQSAIINVAGVEPISPFTAIRVSNPIYTQPYVGYRFSGNLSRQAGPGTSPVGGPSNTAVGAANWSGVVARVFTDSSRIIRVGGGEITLAGVPNATTAAAGTWTADKPLLQNAEGIPLIPPYWSGEKTTSCDGMLGHPIDWWCAYSSSVNVPSLNDFLEGYQVGDNLAGSPRSNWLMAVGSAFVRPWNNVAVSLEVA